jgi:hypothetical protein
MPEGVTEINLRTVLGDDVLDITDAWMLSADTCVLLWSQREGENYWQFLYELIVLDMRDLSILSRTPIPSANYLVDQGWDDRKFCLLFAQEDAHWHGPYTKATIAVDGTVDVSASPSNLTVMPGGKTAIRKEFEGSLYAVDLATGEEGMLIQGVAGLGGGLSYEALLKYIPCPDDIGGYTGEDPFDVGPLDIPFPIDEGEFPGYDIWFFRNFYVYKPLDEHRFVYEVSGWEWGAGYGVYDLQTRTDHRITGRGHFYGMAGNKLFGSTLMTDANTYESSPLPETVQEQFEWISAWEDGWVDHDISPDGRLLALTGMKSRRNDASTVTITDIRTGDIIKTYDIYNPFATEHSVAFCDDTRFVLFCAPEALGSAYIYLFNIEE